MTTGVVRAQPFHQRGEIAGRQPCLRSFGVAAQQGQCDADRGERMRLAEHQVCREIPGAPARAEGRGVGSEAEQQVGQGGPLARLERRAAGTRCRRAGTPRPAAGDAAEGTGAFQRHGGSVTA